MPSDDTPTRRIDPDDNPTVRGFAPGTRVFGRYVLEALAGRGGMGVVWKARDERLERVVALKLLPEVVAGDPEAVRDLLRETKRCLELTHPNIVRVYDLVQDGTLAAISMEYVDGGSLATRKAAAPGGCLTLGELRPLTAQLCAAMDYAHRMTKVVHRDLKPANLLLTRDGLLKVTDFGIARSLSDTRTRLTGRVDNASGTLLYMSPQQLRGDDPAASDDIYALGATLYELLTGRPPFHTGDVAWQIREAEPKPVNARLATLGRKPVPAAWEETILACLAKEPENRPQSASEVARRLRITRRGAGKVGSDLGRAEPDPAGSSWADDRSTVRSSAKEGQTWTVPDLNLGMGYIRPGTFTMGSKNGERDEKPLTRVTLTRGFWLGKTEVTQGQWEALMGSNISDFKGADRPVQRVSWNNAMEFCRKLTERERSAGRLPEGHEYTLPTEAQWEYACRARTRGRYAGNLDKMAWYEENSGNTTHPVGLKQPNAWGLCDMHGNVWEWCRDWHGDYSGGSVRDPTGPSSGSRRVYRGGDWNACAESCRSTVRGGTQPSYGWDFLGFRLALAPQIIQAPTKVVPEAANPKAEGLASLDGLRGPQAGQAWTMPDLNLDMAYVRPGTFMMGSSDSEQGRDDDEGTVMHDILVEVFGPDERPQTRVTLTRGYWLGKTEVTQGQWEALMGNNPSNFKGADRPVEQVSWDDTMQFCHKLTERERQAGRLPVGYEYTLPTEAQWEYACRAGTTGDYAGNLDAMAWYDQNSGNTTHPVGQKQPNVWGLYDMHGNVWELCRDWDCSYPGGSVTDPAGPAAGSYHASRGGCFAVGAACCRSAGRGWDLPDSRISNIGFRVALAPSL